MTDTTTHDKLTPNADVTVHAPLILSSPIIDVDDGRRIHVGLIIEQENAPNESWLDDPNTILTEVIDRLYEEVHKDDVIAELVDD